MRHPLSIEMFADFLGTHDPNQEYVYADSGGCAICQYFDFIGLKYRKVGATHWFDQRNEPHPLPHFWNWIAKGDADDWAERRTFGAAHARALTMLRVEARYGKST